MDEKRTTLGTVKILVFSDGNITVEGPIDNPTVMLSIFGRAMVAVADHIAKQAEVNRAEVNRAIPAALMG